MKHLQQIRNFANYVWSSMPILTATTLTALTVGTFYFMNTTESKVLNDFNNDVEFSMVMMEHDLALRKTVSNPNPVPGENLTFMITVFNQGQSTAQNVEILDKIPAGTTLNDGWWPSGNFVSNVIPGPILPGDSAKISIQLEVSTGTVGSLVNSAEIRSFQDGTGVDVSMLDFDSSPDDDHTNDLFVDNEINDGGTLDEDDHDQASFTVNPCVPVQIATLSEICLGDSTGVNITGGGNLFNWSPAIGISCTDCPNPTFSPTITTTYTLSTSNDGDCPSTGTVTVEILQPILATVNTQSSPDCEGPGDGYISVTAVGGSGDFEFSNNNGLTWQSSSIFENQDAGTYQVRVRNLGGSCDTYVGEAVVVQKEEPSILTVDGVNPSNCALSDGSLEIMAQGNSGTLEYSIDGGETWQATSFFGDLSADVYLPAVRYNDVSCMVVGDAIEIVAPGAPVVVDVASVNPTSCTTTDGSITITAMASAGTIQYSIDGGETWQLSNSFFGLPVSLYNVAVSYTSETCIVNHGLVSLSSVDSPMISNIEVVDATLCNNANGSINIVASGNALQFSIDFGNNYFTNSFFTDLNPGPYTVFVRDNSTGCTVSGGTVQVGQGPAPIISNVFSQDPQDCGVNNGVITVNILNDGVGLLYSIDGGGNFQPSNTFANLGEGTYNVLVNANGGACSSTAGPFTLTDPGAPSINNVAFTEPTNCGASDGTITIDANAGSTFINYTMDGGLSWSSNNSFIGLAAGNYTPGVRNANGTCVVLASAIVIADVVGPTIANVDFTNPTACGAANGTVSVTASGGTGNYEFSIDGGDNYQAASFFDNLGPGDYPVAVRNAGTTCFTVGPIISIVPASEPNITGIFEQNPSGCEQSDGLITVNVDNDNGSFEYSIDAGTTFQSGNVFNNLVAGVYTVIVQTTSSSCQVVHGEVTLEGSDEPVVTNITAVSPGVCGFNDGLIAIEATVNGAGSLEYSIDGGFTWQAVNSFGNLGLGTYSVSVRYQGGFCQVTGGEVILSNPDAPTVDSVVPTNPSACAINDGQLTINASGGGGQYEYSIDAGANWNTANVFSGLVMGIYQPAVRNLDGTCAVFAPEVQLTAPDAPTITTLSTLDPTDCTDNNGSIVFTAEGGTGVYEYSIDGGQSWSLNNVFGLLGPDNYDIALRNSDGTCEVDGGIIALQYEQSPNILLVFAQDPMSCGTEDGFINIAVSNFSTSFEFSVDGGNTFFTNNAFPDLPAGEYNIFVRDNVNGCVVPWQENPILLDEGTLLIENVATTPMSCNGGGMGSITFNVSGGSGVYEFSVDEGNTWSSSNQFDNLGAGTYVLAARNFDGTCITTGETVTITQDANPIVINQLQVSNISCDNVLGTITFMVSGGTGAYEYSVDNGNTWSASSTFTGLVAGIYSPTVRNTDGSCRVDGATAIIGQTNVPTITAVNFSNITSCDAADGSITIDASGDSDLEYSLDGGNSFFGFNEFTLLSAGDYNIAVRYTDGSCQVNYTMNPVVLSSFGNTPSIDDIVVENVACGNPTGSITVVAQGNVEYSNNNGASFQASNVFDGVTQGTYDIVVRFVGEPCIVTSTATVGGNVACTQTMAFNIPFDANFDACLDESILELNALGQTSATICAPANPNTVQAINLVDNCFTLDPTDGFVGTEEICIVYCYNNDPTNCDTTLVQVTVYNPNINCPELFGQDVVDVVVPSVPTDVCVTVPFSIAAFHDIFLNGGNYNGQITPCDVRLTLQYSYAFVFGGGNDGPYMVESWDANGNMFSVQVENMEELVAQMNVWDPNNTWLLDPVLSSIFTVEPVGTFGDIMLTHMTSGTTTTLMTNFPEIPFGTVIEVDQFGENELVLVNPNNGCSDTLIINVIEEALVLSVDTITVNTWVNAPIDEICVDPSEIPGGEVVNFAFCSDPMLGSTPSNGAGCISYFPSFDVIGQDQFCVVACDGTFPVQTCDTTIIIVNIQPITDTLYVFANTDPYTVDVSDVIDLNGDIADADICGFDANAVNVTLDFDMVTIDPINLFFGTTEICVIHCNSDNPAICDTTYIFADIPDPCAGELIFIEETTINRLDPVATFCLPIEATDLADNYTTFLNGAEVLAPFEPCGGTGSEINLNGFGQYELVVQNAIGCRDTVNITFNQLISSVDTIYMSTPFETATDEICLDGTNLDGPLTSFGFLCDTQDGSLMVSNDSCGIYTPFEGWVGLDTACLVVCDNNFPQDCDTTIYVIATQAPTDTLYITTDNLMPFDTCLNDVFVQLPGNLASAVICDSNPAEVTATVIDNCLTLDLDDSFLGSTTEICVVHCDDTNPQFCDTTIVILTSVDPCEDFIADENVTLSSETPNAEYCLAIPLGEIPNYSLAIDGIPYSGSFSGCNEAMFTAYPYATFPDQGTNGPYEVTSLMINGSSFTGTFNTIDELVDLLNMWDPVSQWTLLPNLFAIQATIDTGIYGNMTVTQTATMTFTTVSIDSNTIPNGTVIDITGFGAHELIVTNNADGCTDTIQFNVNEVICNEDFVGDEALTVVTEDCDQLIDVCIDFEINNITDFALFDNGMPYQGGFMGCNNDTVLVYNYFNTADTLSVGPYTITDWTIDGVGMFSGEFMNAQGLVDSLNTWDPMGGWMLDPVAFTIFHANNNVVYSDFNIEQINTGAISPVMFDVQLTPNGTQIQLAVGMHEFVFVQDITECADTVFINVVCDDGGCPEVFAMSPLELTTDQCDMNTEWCVSIAGLDILDYTVTNNGMPYVDGFVPCNSDQGSTLFLPVGDNELIFTNTALNCADTFNVEVKCLFFNDYTEDVTVNLGDDPTVICLWDLGIDTTGLLPTITNTCEDPNVNNATVVLDPATWCVTITGIALGTDQACFEICNADGCATITFNITVLPMCNDLVDFEVAGAGADCLAGGMGEVCLPIPLVQFNSFDVELNGVTYTDAVMGCDFDDSFIISYGSIFPNGGAIGPYEVSLDINGTNYTDTIQTMQEFADSLNVWDPNSMWELDAVNQQMTGGSSNSEYGDLNVLQIATQAPGNGGVNSNSIPMGSSILVPVGMNELVLIDPTNGCTDTVQVQVTCITTETIVETIQVAEMDTFCLSTIELEGNFAFAENLCPGSEGEVAEFTFWNDTCVIVTGFSPGVDTACVVLCDDLGVCDTTYFSITVETQDVDMPIAVNDNANTGIDQNITLNVLGNDIPNGGIDSLYILTQPNFGTAIFNQGSTLTYDPDPGYCDGFVPDSLQYVLCNFNSCDTAWVYITVNCDELLIFNGFSPNGDGTNEVFMIQGIETYPNNRLTIFNRWGERVYQKDGYLNDWSGRWDSSGSGTNRDLPDGTYFYVLELNEEGEEPRTGYLQINR